MQIHNEKNVQEDKEKCLYFINMIKIMYKALAVYNKIKYV